VLREKAKKAYRREKKMKIFVIAVGLLIVVVTVVYGIVMYLTYIK